MTSAEQESPFAVLADVVVRGEEIDQSRAEESIRNAESALAKASADKIALATAQAELAYATAELRTLQKQAWERAMNNSKPNAGTPHDWEEYEKSKEKKDG